MSNPFTKQQIQERFDALPQDIQEIVAGQAMAKRLETIGRRHDLRIDGIGILIEYSGLIMLGLIKSREFVRHLQEKLGISQEQAETIAIEVDDQVFSKIRESLRKVQYRSTEESRFAEVETPMPSSHPYRDADSQQSDQDSATAGAAAAENMQAASTTQEQAAPAASPDTEPEATQAQETKPDASANQNTGAIDGALSDNMAAVDFAPSQSAAAEASRQGMQSTGAAQDTSTAQAPERGRVIDFDQAAGAGEEEIEHSINAAVKEAQEQAQGQPTTGGSTTSEPARDAVPHVTPTGLEQGVDIDLDAGEAAIGAQVEERGQADALRAHQAGAAGIPNPMGEGEHNQAATQESPAPAPEADPEKMKDFQSRLQERLSKEDTSKLDNDPYRESIK